MKILLSNDDGISAPGIIALAKALSSIAQVTIVAPDRNRSGASNSLTLDNPIRLRHVDHNQICVEGTPTDCVHLALTGLLEYKPDMVVSGINAGANLGDDVFYSGTVAAAMEGSFLGVPAIAFSLEGNPPTQYETAAEIAKQLVLRLHQNPLPAKTILNVNIPNLTLNELRGFSITRLGTRHIAEPTLPALDPRGNTIYWIGLPGPEQDAGPSTDFHAIHNKEISLTPLQLDMTHYQVFSKIADWVKELKIA